MPKALLFLFATLLFQTIGLAQINLDTESIDSLFVEWSDGKNPGASLGIYQDGQLVYGKGYGHANLDYDIPNTSKSIFRIASTSKQFTAACIILLEQQQKLELTDPLSKFFPDFPAYADTITVQHLLNHTSGIRDYLTVAYLKGLSDNDHYTDGDIMKWLIRQSSLSFSPGDDMVYSNSGYWLLGQIVNQVAGMNMRDFADKYLFQPLSMKHTHFHNDHTEVVPQRATGYYPSDSSYVESRTTLDMIGDGGIFTSIEDMERWDEAFYTRTILDDDFWNKMTTRGVLNNGDTIDYASGLFLGEYKGLKEINHGGAFVGYRAEYVRFPDQKVGIAVLCNRGDANPSRLAYGVTDIVLKDWLTEKEDEATPVEKVETPTAPVAKIGVSQLVGDYQLNPGMTIQIEDATPNIKVTQLWDNDSYSMSRKSDNTFVPDEGEFSFDFSDVQNGVAAVCSVSQGGNTYPFKRKESVDLSDVNLDAMVGEYYSYEMDATYAITRDGDQLSLQVEDNRKRQLNFEATDELSCYLGMLKIKSDSNNIFGFYLDAGRAKNIFFKKSNN